MAKKTYAEVLADNTQALAALQEQVKVATKIAADAAATAVEKTTSDTATSVAEAGVVARLLGMRLDALTEQGKETNKLLREQNGSIRQHGELLSKHCEWIEGHTKETHKTIDRRFDNQDKKLARATVGETALALIAGAIAWFKP